MGLGALLTRSMPAGPPGPLPPAVREDNGGSWWPTSRVGHQPVNERTAFSVPAFWRAHALVCGGLGALPFHAWRDKDELDPQPMILRRPDPTTTPMAFWTGVLSSITLYGNSICRVTDRDRLGWPTALHPVHPLHAAVRFAGNPEDPDIGGWYISGRFYDPSEVWHVRSYLGRPGSALGVGIIEGMTEGIAVAQALQDYQSSFFSSGAVPTGILKIHRSEITQDQADEAKANWIAKFAGRAEPAVLNELTDFTPLATKPVDSQMIEAANFTVAQVALMWGCPAAKLGAPAGSGTYRNVESEERAFRNDALHPWAKLLEQSADIDLLPGTQRSEFNLDASLRTDTLSRYQAYQAALGGPGPNSAWMLRNEARDIEGYEPMTDAEAEEGQPAPPPAVATEPVPPTLSIPATNGASRG